MITQLLYQNLKSISQLTFTLNQNQILSILSPILTDPEFPLYNTQQQIEKIQYEIKQEIQEIHSKQYKIEQQLNKSSKDEKTDYTQNFQLIKKQNYLTQQKQKLINLYTTLENSGELII